jgi:hypothetical protein
MKTDICTFVIIARSVLLRMRNIPYKFVEKIKTRILFAVDLDLDLAGGEGPSSPGTPRPYRQALCIPF